MPHRRQTSADTRCGSVTSMAEEIWSMLSDEHTYVYIAGLKQIRDALNDLFSAMSGSANGWAKLKGELIEQGRWVELLY